MSWVTVLPSLGPDGFYDHVFPVDIEKIYFTMNIQPWKLLYGVALVRQCMNLGALEELPATQPTFQGWEPTGHGI